MPLIEFQTWFEAFRLKDADKFGRAQKKVQKFRRARQFKPGTFGIELEFHPEEPEIDHNGTAIKLQDEPKVQEAFNKLAKKYWKPLNPDEWLEDNPMPEEPEEDDQNHQQWESDIEEWENEYSDIQNDWDEWENTTEPQKYQDFVDGIIERDECELYGVTPEYSTEHHSNVAYERLEDVVQAFEDEGLDHGVINGDASSSDWDYSQWIIHVDGSNIEVTSPILTLDDRSEVEQVIGLISGESVSGGTSAHVHVGIPDDTDVFDLLAATTLPDENAIWQADPGRNQKFTQSKDDLHFKIYAAFKNGEYSEDVFKHTLSNSMNTKHFGVNIYSDMNSNRKSGSRTIEFRYLSSRIIQDPDAFFRFIEYYTKLPTIARGRQQVKLNVKWGSEMATIYFTRLPGGNIRVDKDPLTKVPRVPGTPEDLRKPIPQTPTQERMEVFIWKKFRKMGVWLLPDWGVPIDRFLYAISEALKQKTKEIIPYSQSHLMAKAVEYGVTIGDIAKIVPNRGIGNPVPVQTILAPILVKAYRDSGMRHPLNFA